MSVAVEYLLLGIADLTAPDHRWLAPGELEVLDGLRFLKRRSEWRLGRWTVKRAAALRLGIPAEARDLARLEVRVDPGGAPEILLDGSPAALSISLSHSEGRALCSTAPPGVALGCDIEEIAPRSRALVDRFFAPDERALVHGAEDADRDLVANLVWSAKESVLKALKKGLAVDTRTVSVCPTLGGPGAAWRPLEARHGESGRVFPGWWRRDGRSVLTLVSDPPPGVPVVPPA